MTFNFICMVTVFVHKFSWMINSSMFITMCLMFGIPSFRQSETIIVPGSIHFWMMGSSVCWSHFYTATRKHFLLSSSILPKTHWPSTWWPPWYFLLPNLLSSICTSFPFLPSFSPFSSRVISQTSWQKLSQSTPVLSASLNSCFICVWSRSWHHQYVNFKISSKVILLLSNQLPFLINTFTLCFLPFTCFLHSHFKPSDRSSHLVKLISPAAHIGQERSFAISPSFINECTNISLSCIHVTRSSCRHLLCSR